MKKFLLVLLIATGLFTACEKMIDIDIENMQPHLVVDALGSTDEPLTVVLTESRPVFGIHRSDEGFPRVTDAIVTLTVNGAAPVSANRDSNCYTLPYTPQAGDSLALRIERPGHAPATASTIVPFAPTVGPIEQPATTINSEYSNEVITFSIPLSDPEASTDYYYITMHRTDTIICTYLNSDSTIVAIDTTYNTSKWFECHDQLVVTDVDVLSMIDQMGAPTYYGEMLLFRDERFNGQSHNIQISDYFYVDDYSVRNNVNAHSSHIVVHSTYTIDMASLSRDSYLYLNSLQALENSDAITNFFSEPVQLLTNIDGAIGIFGITNKKSHTCRYTHEL